MPSPLRDPKSLSQWIDLDYFKRRRRFKRLSTYVYGGTFVAFVLAVAATLVVGQHQAYQADSLSRVHALCNHDCRQCHTEAFQTWRRFWTHDESIRSVSDAACSKCHSGTPHHADLVAGHATATHCVFCHREHRGDRELTHVPDDFCQRCHADLQAVTNVKPRFQDVPNWRAHPDFMHRWLSATQNGKPEDPGTIAFNHAVHMQAEGVLALDKMQFEQQWGQEGAAERARPVQRKILKCSACHEPDSAGRYMKPINFEQHCRECHPLSVQIVAAAHETKKRDLLRRFAEQPAPHADVDVVRGVLRNRLTDFILQHPEFLEATTAVPRPIPGRRPSAQHASKEQFDWVNKQQSAIEAAIFSKPGWCRRCHEPLQQEAELTGKLPEFRKSNINWRLFPERHESLQWFPHSRFSHATHRMRECTSCHAGIDKSTKTAEVHMPTIASCRECHGGVTGGARTDCVACHIYHPSPSLPWAERGGEQVGINQWQK